MVDPDGATCSQCGAPISPGESAGLCPRCFLSQYFPNLRVNGVAGDGKLKHVSHTYLRLFHLFRRELCASPPPP